MKAGESATITATVKPNSYASSLTWQSSNPQVSSVSGDGRVKAVSAGVAIISCRLDGDTSAQANCIVLVTEDVAVESISLNRSSATLNLANQAILELYARITPANASNQNVTWSSSDESVASVKNGVVTPVSVGSAVITCTSVADESISAACSVQVYASRLLDEAIITGDKQDSLNIGDQMQLGVQLKPSNSYAAVRWTSSDESVATVSSTGLVTALAGGTATISAITQNSRQDALTLMVIDPSMPTGITLSLDEMRLGIKEQRRLAAEVLPETAEAEIIWESSNTKIVTVDENGQLTGIKRGSAEILVTALGSDGRSFTDTLTVEVKYAPTRVKLDKTSLTIFEGDDAVQLNASLGSGYASALEWKSSDETIATVDESGLITSHPSNVSVSKSGKISVKKKTLGTAAITLTAADALEQQVYVTVCSAPSKPTLSEKAIELFVGEEYQIEAIIGEDEATSFSNSSGSKRVASVSKSGLVTAKKAGTAKITVRTHNKKTATLTVKLTNLFDN